MSYLRNSEMRDKEKGLQEILVGYGTENLS